MPLSLSITTPILAALHIILPLQGSSSHDSDLIRNGSRARGLCFPRAARINKQQLPFRPFYRVHITLHAAWRMYRASQQLFFLIQYLYVACSELLSACLPDIPVLHFILKVLSVNLPCPARHVPLRFRKTVKLGVAMPASCML